MTDHIRCALAWLRALLRPTPVPVARRRPAHAQAPRIPHQRTLPAHRAQHSAPFVDGDASPLVRPYLTVHEQQERRTALALALDGIDVGPWIIHGVPIGAAA
ncbi:hypothetical protein GCM10009801_81640 [Streptomyces albiaxialis]|uniref:Uncharacterized protein n=1 Tax=Streptomyces albiaxialis TaxID=329523 RepID=A0ABN2X584_9ACTN